MIVYYLHVITCVYNHRCMYTYSAYATYHKTSKHDNTIAKRSMWVTPCRPLVAMAAAQLKSTWSHQGLDSMGFLGNGIGQKRWSGRIKLILHKYIYIVTKNIELDCQQWEVYGGYSIQLYTLDFRLKTQNNVPELAGLVRNKTYKPLVSIWPPALPKAPSVDTTKENHHIQ